MTLKDKQTLAEQLIDDKEMAKILCSKFIFEVSDIIKTSGTNDKHSELIRPKSNGVLDVYKLRFFRVDLKGFIKLIPDISNIISDDKIKQIISMLKLIFGIATYVKIKKEVTGDHAILLACLSKMHEEEQEIEEKKLHTFFNKIKCQLKQDILGIHEFSSIINDLMIYRIINIEDGKIKLNDYIINKTNLNQIFSS